MNRIFRRRAGHRAPRRALSLVLLAMTVAAAGCATGPRIVRTEVTSFNEFGQLPASRTYVFARTLEYRDSLEMQSYEAIARDELTRQGFRLAAEPSQAELSVTLRPSVSITRVVVGRPFGGDPFYSFGGFGGFAGRGYGGYYGPFGPYGGAFFGGPYGGFYDNDVDVARQRIELDIDSRSSPGKRFYEGKVESTSGDGSTTTLMPSLIRALFADFPGNNGQTRRVDVPLDPQ